MEHPNSHRTLMIMTLMHMHACDPRFSMVEGLQKCCGKPAHVVSPGMRPRIQAKDYKPLEVTEHTTCCICCTTWSHHVEKLHEERKLHKF